MNKRKEMQDCLLIAQASVMGPTVLYKLSLCGIALLHTIWVPRQ